MENNEAINAVTCRTYGNNINDVMLLRRGIVYEEDGLMEMKDINGLIICPPEYKLIAKCNEYVFLLDQKGSYKKAGNGWSVSGLSLKTPM